MFAPSWGGLVRLRPRCDIQCPPRSSNTLTRGEFEHELTVFRGRLAHRLGCCCSCSISSQRFSGPPWLVSAPHQSCVSVASRQHAMAYLYIDSPAWKAPTLDTVDGTDSARRLILFHTVQVLSPKILDSVGTSQGTLSDTPGHCVAG
jgi:hypothetical protein